MERGIRYHGVFRHIDNAVELYVDGKRLLKKYDPLPLNGIGNSGIIMKSSSDSLRIHSLKIVKLRDPKLISPTKVGDTLLHRGLMSDALEVYENQYKLYNDSKIQEEALFKAAVASYKLGDLDKFTKLRQE